MVKNLKTKIQEFARGKYSVFGDLFDAVKKPVWDYFWKKTQGNQNLTKILYMLTMNNLLNYWTQEGNLKSYDESDFFKLVEMQTEAVWGQFDTVVDHETLNDQLKLNLEAELKNKKAHDSRFFAYYVHHFKYYLFGACVVGGIGIFAFLLGFLTINKIPRFFSNPKIFSMTGDQAFGSFSGTNKASTIREENHLLGTGDFGEYFLIKKENFPSLPKTLSVAKRVDQSIESLSTLMKILDLPALRRDKFAEKKLKSLTFGSGSMQVSLDLELRKLSMSYENGTRLSAKDSFATSEKAIKKNIKSQLQNLGLSFEHYGQINIDSPITGEVISAFIPRIFNEKLIYDEQGRMLGVQIQYHLRSEQILSIDNYSFESWEVSKYPVVGIETLLQNASKIGLYENDIASHMQNLNRGELVYQEKGGFLLPMVRWNISGKQVFLALVEGN
ncbi:MAG: hypothetical protein HG456_003725 [candidate division SR1 bacterium]|nr:hypothetical protein [candidate division SR1 bacterium]